MAGFIEITEKFNKICDYYSDTEKGCTACPLMNDCYDTPANPKKVEEIVMNWQLNVYPTILELIRHIAEYLPAREDGKHWYEIPFNELVHNRIPEEVAKKFGIMPINACGIMPVNACGNVEEDDIGSEWR